MCPNRTVQGIRDNFWLEISVKGSEKEGITNNGTLTAGQIF